MTTKKYLYCILIFVILIGLPACNNPKPDNKTEENDQPETVETTIIKEQKEQAQAIISTEEKIKDNESPEEIETIKDKVIPTEDIRVTFIELGSVKCIPCKMMQPILDEIEKEYAGQVEVVFYDVWTPAGRPYAQKYRIRGIPTQIFLDKDGNEYFRHVGYFPKDELVTILKMQGVE